MKRISELEENAKRVCQETAEEVARIKASDSFIPLLDADLAEWKAKLRSSANSTSGKWKLVLYSEPDRSLEQYGRGPYHPNIFSDQPWLVKYWVLDIVGSSGESATVAYADKPEDLVPSALTFKRILLFRLPFMICPTTYQPPRTLHKLYEDETARVMMFGWRGVYAVDRSRFDLLSVAEIEHPDLENPEHVEIIYKWWRSTEQREFKCEQQITHLKAKRTALCTEIDADIRLCKAAYDMQKRLMK